MALASLFGKDRDAATTTKENIPITVTDAMAAKFTNALTALASS